MKEEIMSVLESLEADQIDYYFESDTWRKLSACKGMPPGEFHPKRGADQEELHIFCGGCMVQTECLTYALLRNENNGFWGNHSERARRQIRKRLKRTRPDLLKAGAKLASMQNKGLYSKLAKSVRGVDVDVEMIDEGELMEHLLPKARDLIHRIAQRQGTVNTEHFMLGLNISAEAFFQRLNLTRQLEWVRLEGEDLKLTRKGREQLVDGGMVTVRAVSKQPTTPQEVSMANDEYEWLNDLDIEILACLAGGEIEDSANASGILAEKIGVETGSSFSNHLKRLDDEGLIRRRVNGKRTNYLAITGKGSKALHVLGVPSSSVNKPSAETGSVPVSNEIEKYSSKLDEGLMERFDDFIGRLHNVLAENALMRARVSELVTEGLDLLDEAKAALSVATEEKEELERLRPLADRYSQMQKLLSAPTE